MYDIGPLTPFKDALPLTSACCPYRCRRNFPAAQKRDIMLAVCQQISHRSLWYTHGTPHQKCARGSFYSPIDTSTKGHHKHPFISMSHFHIVFTHPCHTSTKVHHKQFSYTHVTPPERCITNVFTHHITPPQRCTGSSPHTPILNLENQFSKSHLQNSRWELLRKF